MRSGSRKCIFKRIHPMDVSLMEEVSYFAIQNHTIVEVKGCQDLDYACSNTLWDWDMKEIFLNILALCLDYVASTGETLRKPVRQYRSQLAQLSINAAASPDTGGWAEGGRLCLRLKGYTRWNEAGFCEDIQSPVPGRDRTLGWLPYKHAWHSHVSQRWGFAEWLQTASREPRGTFVSASLGVREGKQLGWGLLTLLQEEQPAFVACCGTS